MCFVAISHKLGAVIPSDYGEVLHIMYYIRFPLYRGRAAI